VSRTYKRPTHESDAMKIFLSDSVAPEILPLLKQYNDFAAVAIAFSAKMSPDFWNSLLTYVRYCVAMRRFFERLRAEGKPLKREWLRRIKAFAARFDDNARERPTLYLLSTIAGVKAWSVFTVDYAKELIVDVLDEKGRRKESFKLMIEG
jgi:hypothetical protein